MPDDELAALAAHWLLGRLSVLQATISHLATADGLTTQRRLELLDLSREVSAQMQESLEAMARGLPAAARTTLIDLSDRVAVSPPE
ncbi:hypothetical protein [Actinospongicola halichondriae]|uniref:hypothetical protein n=1 Tax=Actinospongicola halichondriae TaxID=3236844 RepID=UPI003D4EAC37